MRQPNMSDYTHPELNKRVEFFGGGYSFIEEGKIAFRGKEVLYSVGVANIESSCCGPRGCAFIRIPGTILSWKKRMDEQGQVLSEVERIVDEESQREIRKILEAKFPGFYQIEFSE